MGCSLPADILNFLQATYGSAWVEASHQRSNGPEIELILSASLWTVPIGLYWTLSGKW
jgi:hypothetical protein